MFEELVRVMELSFETCISDRISVRHPVFVEHAVETLSIYHVGAEGRSPPVE